MAHGLNGRGLKRLPGLSSSLHTRYAQKSKADWEDLYFDLYRQVFGEQAPDEECMADAERRLEVLKRYRQPAQDEAERPFGQPANYDDTPVDFEPDPDLYYQEQRETLAEQLGDLWTGEGISVQQKGDWQPAYARDECGAFWREGPGEDAEF